MTAQLSEYLKTDSDSWLWNKTSLEVLLWINSVSSH